jgi:hypothetical protein
LVFNPKLVLICLFVLLSMNVLIGLDNHNEDFFLQWFTQTDGTESPAIRDSFSAIGTISSLVITVSESEFKITNAFKVILTGEWNLSVKMEL